MAQIDLFGKKVEWHSEKWKQHMQKVEEHNQRCTEKREKSRLQGENVGSFPCPIAQQFPVGEMRRKHIENCETCKKLEREFDRSIGVWRSLWNFSPMPCPLTVNVFCYIHIRGKLGYIQ